MCILHKIVIATTVAMSGMRYFTTAKNSRLDTKRVSRAFSFNTRYQKYQIHSNIFITNH